VLRAWRPDDVDFFARLYTDPEVTRYLGDGSTLDRATTWRAVAAAIGHWALRGYGQWVVTLRSTGEAIGRSGLYNPEGWPDLEVGYVIAPVHQGHGYATEAAGAALRHAIDVVGARRVISLIHPENVRSQRVAERLGGVREPDIEFFGRTVRVYGYPTGRG
jgi:RimJ/RimL family protein N-acetyltransferase